MAYKCEDSGISCLKAFFASAVPDIGDLVYMCYFTDLYVDVLISNAHLTGTVKTQQECSTNRWEEEAVIAADQIADIHDVSLDLIQVAGAGGQTRCWLRGVRSVLKWIAKLFQVLFFYSN